MSKLIELVLQANYAGQEIINRFNYLAAGSPAEPVASAALIQAFGCIPDTGVYPDGLPFRRILELVSPDLEFIFASARDVYGDTDFAEIPFVPAAVGLATGFGQGESPTVAFGLRTNRIVRNVRRGTKRFAGVGEGGLDALGVLSSTAISLLQDVADTMSATLTQVVGANTYTFEPVVVGKMRYTPPTPTYDPAGTAYRYWPTLVAQMDHIAINPTWEIYQESRTQTSRQYGKGR